MPAPATLQDRIATFVEGLAGVTDGRVIANRWRAELRHHQDRTPATLKLYVTKYRNSIRERFGADAPALAHVKHDPAVMTQVRTDYKARVATEHRTLIPMPNWRELRAKAIQLLDSPDPLDLAAGLLLITGRRSYEICCTATLDLVPIAGTKGFEKWRLAFSGQAKTRGADGTKAGETYIIPCLAPAGAVRRAYRRFRVSPIGMDLWGLDGAAFSQRMAGRLNNAVKINLAHFFSDGVAISTKSLRSLYAEIAYRHFAGPGQSKSAFFAEILGHQQWDLETSLSYFDFYLDDEDEAAQAVNDAQAQLLEAAKLRGDTWAEPSAGEEQQLEDAGEQLPPDQAKPAGQQPGRHADRQPGQNRGRLAHGDDG